mmetsp:Transcript_18334/g.70829  ORF Transcript_18334/g.70829 Transcript_18334/m.70829 type:complete len:640 (+) Transcript_18334:68-1987(+)
MPQVVKIVVVGDAKTGKSSLITAAVTNEFSREVLATLPPLVDEPKMGKDCPLRKYIDTSDRRELIHEGKRKQALKSADVVCIVYDVTRPETFDSVANRWMPALNALGLTTPVVLLGNKLDLREPGDKASLAIRHRIVPLVQQYGNQIEWCLECSAKTMECVHEAFSRAVDSVLYPSAPLFDVSSQQLSQKFLAALANIFKLIDYDRDGLLTDDELLAYQQCYSPNMTMDTIEKLREVVRKFSPDCMRDDKITLEGFVVIHQFLVQNSKFRAVWELLTTFGYGTDLLLSNEFLRPDIGYKDGHVTQLEEAGFQFLRLQFERFDADRDGLLSPQEQKELYETTPSDPFRFKGALMCEASPEAPELITQEGLLALWCKKTHVSPGETSKYLRFMGYRGSMKDAIAVLRGKKGPSILREHRHTYQCFVFGSAGCGKSAILRRLTGKARNAPVDLVAVNAVPDGQARPRYLVLREFSEHGTEELVALGEGVVDEFAKCDLVCLAYDASDSASFRFAASIYEELQSLGVSLPFVFVACKADLPFAVFPESTLSPEQYCSKHALISPLRFSQDTEAAPCTFSRLLEIAADPREAKRQSNWGWLAGFGLGALLFGAGAFLVSQNWQDLVRLLRPLLVMPQTKLLKRE